MDTSLSIGRLQTTENNYTVRGIGRAFPMLSAFKTDSLTAESMAAGSAIAPFPVSPHANLLEIGEITITPKSSNDERWRCVNGLVHINVFIAGATNIGFEKSQARTMQVRRLSHNPPATCTHLHLVLWMILF
jgi:hypothetical protein